MIYIGIDISKYKHDCFICKDTGEVLVENLSFENTKKGFQKFHYVKFFWRGIISNFNILENNY